MATFKTTQEAMEAIGEGLKSLDRLLDTWSPQQARGFAERVHQGTMGPLGQNRSADHAGEVGMLINAIHENTSRARYQMAELASEIQQIRSDVAAAQRSAAESAFRI